MKITSRVIDLCRTLYSSLGEITRAVYGNL